MSDTDLIKLYSPQILALAADMPATEPLTNPQARVTQRAPLCGSQVSVELTTQDGRITQYAQDVKACALGQAAASVLARSVIGLTRQDLTILREQVREMLAEDGPTPPAPFDGFEVLRAARGFPNRHGSILLALDATLAALDQLPGNPA